MKVSQLSAHRDGSFLNERLIVEAIGEPGRGGARLHYLIKTPDQSFEIRFQSKDPAEGIDGVSNEALLCILADRLLGFQSGRMACDENANALSCVQRAAHFLAERTRARIAGGVEGKAVPLPAAEEKAAG